MSTARQVFSVSGMHCTSCAMTIDWELEDLDGVIEARTKYAAARTEVSYDPARVSVQDILDVIAHAGFSAAPAS